MRCKPLAILAVLGVGLLLGGCGTQIEEARPAFGYSGLAAGDPTLSSYEQAKADFAAARYGLAAKRFRMAMADDPASVEAVNGLAAAYDQLGRYDLAERYYRRALAMDPTSVQTLNNFGYSLLLQGRHDLALAFFRDAVRFDPENAVIVANAEQAVAARLVIDEPASASAGAVPMPQAAGAPQGPESDTGPRIVRLNAAEQQLQLQPRLAAAAAVAAPAMPAVPVLPVDARPLPALPAPADVRLAPIPVALRPTVRVAAPAEAQDAVLMPAGPAEVSAAAVALAGTIELANGNGRRLMAARMQAYLGQSGIVAARLTNADHFAHAATLITFRPGHRGLAEALSASLPVTPRLQEVSAQASDVRVLLGGDLLEFDRALLQAERIRSHADAV